MAELGTTEMEGMVKLCEEQLSRSYSPYSNFAVASAILTMEGKVFSGCNVENVSYGLSICAERTAAVKAVSEGYRKFKACVVITRSPDKVAPCGACRQFLAEFGQEMTLYLFDKDHNHDKYQLKDLLPLAFTPAALENGTTKPGLK